METLTFSDNQPNFEDEMKKDGHIQNFGISKISICLIQRDIQ